MSIIIISLIAAYYLFNRPAGPQTFTNYTEPGAFSISYPSGWLREEQGLTSGAEILSIYSYDYRNLAVADQSFGPGQIKITVSILAKGVNSLEQIADNQFIEMEKNYRKELLIIDGRQAIRISSLSEPGTGLSPRIKMYVDYSDNQYALITGDYYGDKTSAIIIRRIQESFRTVKKLNVEG